MIKVQAQYPRKAHLILKIELDYLEFEKGQLSISEFNGRG